MFVGSQACSGRAEPHEQNHGFTCWTPSQLGFRPQKTQSSNVFGVLLCDVRARLLSDWKVVFLHCLEALQ